MKSQRFFLPYPPSVNSYWRHVVMGKGVRVLISEKGREYRKLVEKSISLQKCITFPTERLELTVDLFPPDLRKRDIDNALKALLDSMAHAGIYEDDSQIDRIIVNRKQKRQGGEAAVLITETEEVTA